MIRVRTRETKLKQNYFCLNNFIKISEKENLENGRSKSLKKTLLDKPMKFIKIKY